MKRDVDPRRRFVRSHEPDAFALEEALRQREKHTGEVVVVTAGPARAQQVLREALAKGADRAIHLEGDGFVALDAYNTARAIAAAIKDEKFDLIFTGLQSDDYGYAQTGVILAEILGWPHATIIMQIERNESGIRVKRSSRRDFSSSWMCRCRRADDSVRNQQAALRTLIGIKQAKAKPLRKVALAEVQSAIGATCKRSRSFTSPRNRRTQNFWKVRRLRLRRNWWID